MGEENSFAIDADTRTAWKSAVLVLIFLGTLILTTESNAVSANESALMKRMPTSMKLTARDAISRIKHWKTFIEGSQHKSDADKIISVNAYFNTMHFIEDVNLWHKPDYWATPLQMLATGAGDCEDFAIAKYFTLKALGITEELLRITYVWNLNKQSSAREPHMILTYTDSITGDLLVLDSMTNDIRPLVQHQEMEPVYGLNSKGLWLVDEDSKVIAAGSPDQLPQWRKLIEDIAEDMVLLQIQ